MKILVCFLICGCLALARPGAVRAEALDDDTRCGTMAALLGTEDGKASLPEVISYILEIADALDRAHALQGRPEVLSAMTEEGRIAIALIVVDRCAARPDLTVADTAVATYQAVRAMRRSLALGTSKTKVAQSRARRDANPKPRSTARSGVAALGLFDTLR